MFLLNLQRYDNSLILDLNKKHIPSVFRTKSMCTIDIILAVCFLPAIYLGIRNGLVRQLVSLCAVFFGIKLGVRFSAAVSTWLGENLGMTEFWSKSISFVLIFLAAALIISIIGRGIGRIVKFSLLGWLDRLLGLVLALIVAALIISAGLQMFSGANNMFHIISDEKLAESQLLPVLKRLTENLMKIF